MPLPTTGPITLLDIANEFGGTAPHSLDEYLGKAAGIPSSGTLDFAVFRGKSSKFAHTITAHQKQINLRTYLLSAGWDGVSSAEVTINTGVYIWSDSRTIAALTTGSPYAGGLTLINKGFIMGKGGDGGYVQANRTSYVAATTGGPAIVLNVPITINNASGYIGGGGGGGAGAFANVLNVATVPYMSAGGGGAGGGRGGPVPYGDVNGTVLSSFGNGGTIGQNGSVATNGNTYILSPPRIPTHGGGGGASGACAIFGVGI